MGILALQVHANISSVERHGTRHAHPTTVAATPIGPMNLGASLPQTLK
jgi:hypothetical protein